MQSGKCVATGKVQYDNRRQARLALHALAKRRIGACEQSAYVCPFCGLWHISKQAERRKAPRMEPVKRWKWDPSTEE